MECQGIFNRNSYKSSLNTLFNLGIKCQKAKGQKGDFWQVVTDRCKKVELRLKKSILALNCHREGRRQSEESR